MAGLNLGVVIVIGVLIVGIIALVIYTGILPLPPSLFGAKDSSDSDSDAEDETAEPLKPDEPDEPDEPMPYDSFVPATVEEEGGGGDGGGGEGEQQGGGILPPPKSKKPKPRLDGDRRDAGDFQVDEPRSNATRPIMGWNEHRKMECEQSGGSWDGTKCFHDGEVMNMNKPSSKPYIPDGDPYAAQSNTVSGDGNSLFTPVRKTESVASSGLGGALGGLVGSFLGGAVGGAALPFPKEWGTPPPSLDSQQVDLPGGFGKGTAAVAGWVASNLVKDKVDWVPDSMKCAGKKDTWKTAWGSSPEERCEKWSGDYTWGALKNGRTLFEACKTAFGRTQCAATCCGVKDTEEVRNMSSNTTCDKVWANEVEEHGVAMTCGDRVKNMEGTLGDGLISKRDRAKEVVAKRFPAQCGGLRFGTCPDEGDTVKGPPQESTRTTDSVRTECRNRFGNTWVGDQRFWCIAGAAHTNRSNWGTGLKGAKAAGLNVDCDDSGLQSFQLKRDSGNGYPVRYKYGCVAFNMSKKDMRGSAPNYQLTDYGSRDRHGRVVSLNGLTVDCVDRPINQFRVVFDTDKPDNWKKWVKGDDANSVEPRGDQGKPRYEYTCNVRKVLMREGFTPDCAEDTTQWEWGGGTKGGGSGRIKWLDRLDVNCNTISTDSNKTFALTAFKLETDGEQRNRYWYKCCAVYKE